MKGSTWCTIYSVALLLNVFTAEDTLEVITFIGTIVMVWSAYVFGSVDTLEKLGRK